MKKIFIPTLMLGLFFTSCKNESSSKESTTPTISLTKSYDDSLREEADKQIEKAKEEAEATIAGTDFSSESTTSSSAASNTEELLQSYEAFIDDYINALKKVKAGDMSFMTEYPKLMEKAQAIDSKIKENQAELTKDQMKRYIKLQTKMSNAMVDMM